jgi:hypothetical protein
MSRFQDESRSFGILDFSMTGNRIGFYMNQAMMSTGMLPPKEHNDAAHIYCQRVHKCAPKPTSADYCGLDEIAIEIAIAIGRKEENRDMFRTLI